MYGAGTCFGAAPVVRAAFLEQFGRPALKQLGTGGGGCTDCDLVDLASPGVEITVTGGEALFLVGAPEVPHRNENDAAGPWLNSKVGARIDYPKA